MKNKKCKTCDVIFNPETTKNKNYCAFCVAYHTSERKKGNHIKKAIRKMHSDVNR